MSRLPDSDNIRNDIYENLPCQAMFNESVRKIKVNEPIVLNNCNQSSNKKSNLSKELLYAAPIRKSDRYKSGERSRYKAGTGAALAAAVTNKESSISEKSDKLHNVVEYKLINKDNTALIKNGTSSCISAGVAKNGTAIGCGSGGVSGGVVYIAPGDNESSLEDRRILNFLKDTTQVQRKVEMGKDCPNASFSCLAREEHFANLVQQNFTASAELSSASNHHHSANISLNEPAAVAAATTMTDDDSGIASGITKTHSGGCDDSEQATESAENLEVFMDKKQSPDKEVNGLVAAPSNYIVVRPTNVYINREWALKKIALCLEQRASGKKPLSAGLGPSLSSASKVDTEAGNASSFLPRPNAGNNGGQSSYHGCLILGSNGSGKTSICQNIMNGNSGTRGLLNRKLLSCYFVNSQNPDCHNLSIFIRSMVLQILSHSSTIAKERVAEILQQSELKNGAKIEPAQHTQEELLIDELALENNKPHEDATKKVITRQKSAPSPEKKNETDVSMKATYSTHPPSKSSDKTKTNAENEEKNDEQQDNKDNPSLDSIDPSKAKSSPSKKSKIPVAITSRVPKSNNSIQQGGGEDIADVSGEDLKDAIEAEINDDGDPEQRDEEELPEALQMIEQQIPTAPPAEEEEEINIESVALKSDPIIPPPLPKSKSCRTLIADGYYEMLLSNPEILECLSVDSIEKNPDECFKKALLFPLLELTPPRNALLLLIDSIDENYINEGNLISTLKGRCSTQRSRNIAELLSNHIHLFPKWLFLVATTKKQNKHVTKMFSGFKKITLDDLRKSHVVKDVQEYIINRLNTDFKGTINLTKEIIESLHQLYIKSNGCILYLEKVLDGIKENFFSFREIKLIPCTLNGLYLYICQKSFNKKQYMKIRPILNILLASTGVVDKLFVFNCLRTHNYTIDMEEFEKRLDLMKNILTFYRGGGQLKIFHNSFADWLVDVKFSTKKFLCDVNEGHVMISMYYMLVSETLCANNVRRFVYHLIKSGEYLASKNVNLDLILLLLESRVNLSDCFYTNLLNCCQICEAEFKNHSNFPLKTRNMLERFLMNELNEEISTFLCDFFKPSLPTDAKTLKLLIETGINNAETQLSCDSSLNSPEFSERSQNIDCELADLLISTEKSCQLEIQRPKSSSEKSEPRQASISGGGGGGSSSQDENTTALNQLSDLHRMELHKGKALIHILSNEGNHVLLERALNACKGPIDLEIEDYNGQTALNIAARNGHLEVVKLLLTFSQMAVGANGDSAEHHHHHHHHHQQQQHQQQQRKGVDVNHPDRDGWTPLRSASWGGHTEVVKLLIAHPDCSIDFADKEGRTALRAAAWSGHEDILKILIEADADVNSVDRQGRTSLIAASYMGHYDIVEILLENGANVNHLDLDGRSALCVAALCGSSGYSKVISTLLEHGANTDQLDNDGMSPLLVSSFEGNADICELLLENGADPDLADFMGRTPLWAACTAGHAAVVKLLLFWGCGIDCMDSEGRTVLSIAAAQGNVETIRQLLDRGLDETHRDNAGWTPLHYAAFEGFHDVCIQVLESGAKIDECDNEGKTALHLASQEGRQSCVQALLEIHNAFVDQKAHDGKTGFRLACLEGHIDCIQTLLKFGCDVNCKDADSRTTLYILALENKLEIVKYLLDVTDIDVNIPDSEGRTALHVAAWQGHTEMVKMLITLGNADVNAMDLECRTPLHSCAWQGNHEVMEILLYFGAIPDHACKQGATALGISAQEGHDKCVAILLKYGANPYKSDHCGRTPIKLAAKSNRNNILKIFDSYTKNESNMEPRLHPNLLRSPDNPPERSPGFHVGTQQSHQSNNHLGPNNNMPPSNVLNASNSTHSSNFYENTMQSDNSSLQKRKSVISSQSTGSSNEAPLSFTQQLQRHSKLNSHHNNPFTQAAPIVSSKRSKGHQKHSQMLPDLDEYQLNLAASNATTNEADMFDMECMSPLYATPPHSPSSELSSPGQLPSHHTFEEIGNNIAFTSTTKTSSTTNADHHFARDTHMRIILGNPKETNHSSKSKRSGIATNPAVRMIRSRFDSAAQLIRRTNNILNITSSSNQGSSSIGVKSGTFQWRKESQM